MTKLYFREQPPDSLILIALESIGLIGFSDFKFVSESFVLPTIQKKVIQEVEKYYYPCYAKVFIKEEMTYSNYITIVRQLLKTKGFVLERKTTRKPAEKKNDNSFEGQYRIVPGETLPGEITVRFD